VVHEVWYPGWQVFLDGKRARIDAPADKTSWQAAIPAGTKRAEFCFVPADFRIGLFSSLVTLLGLASGLGLKRKAEP
jgi:uncharacterized membrane protein YfhO